MIFIANTLQMRLSREHRTNICIVYCVCVYSANESLDRQSIICGLINTQITLYDIMWRHMVPVRKQLYSLFVGFCPYSYSVVLSSEASNNGMLVSLSHHCKFVVSKYTQSRSTYRRTQSLKKWSIPTKYINSFNVRGEHQCCSNI